MTLEVKFMMTVKDVIAQVRTRDDFKGQVHNDSKKMS